MAVNTLSVHTESVLMTQLYVFSLVFVSVNLAYTLGTILPYFLICYVYPAPLYGSRPIEVSHPIEGSHAMKVNLTESTNWIVYGLCRQ